LIVEESNQLIHTQKWDGKQSTITRYVDEEDRLVMVGALIQKFYKLQTKLRTKYKSQGRIYKYHMVALVKSTTDLRASECYFRGTLFSPERFDFHEKSE